MSNAIAALGALLRNFNDKQDETFAGLEKLFSSNDEFLQKVKTFDALFDGKDHYAPVKEYAFDLLMAHHLENNNSNSDYFDSKEWQDIEDKTIERGTELLNILLYISEAKDTGAPVTIDDFLYEFLLVDEDEFQDEHRIYEELIANQELVEEELVNILTVSKTIPEELEIKELFLPLILFFKEPGEKNIRKETYTKLSPIDRSLLGCLLAYNA